MAAPSPALETIAEHARAYKWNVLMLLAASQMIAYVDRVNISVAVPVLIKNYHYTPTSVGLLMSFFNLAFTLALLISGPFVDRVRARVGYIVGVGVWSVATVLCGTSTAFASLALWRGIVGVGEGPMIPAGQRVILETFPKEQRASAVATFFAGNKVGLALGIPFATILLHVWGLPWVFYITGALGFVWVGWFCLSYRGVGKVPAVKSTMRWSTLLKYRTTWGIMLGQAGYLYIYYVFASWLPGYLVLQRKMSILKSGVVGMLPFVVGVIATILGGYISDWMAKRGARITVARKTLTCGGLFLATIFTLLGAYTSGLWLAVTYLTLAIAGFSLATGSCNSMTVDIAPPHIVSSLVSLQNFGGNVGGSLAPLVTGVLFSWSGDFTLPLLVTAGVALVFGCGSYGLVVGSLDQTLGQPATKAPAATGL
jgi:MFS family permease